MEDDVLGRNPLEGDLDSIWNNPSPPNPSSDPPKKAEKPPEEEEKESEPPIPIPQSPPVPPENQKVPEATPPPQKATINTLSPHEEVEEWAPQEDNLQLIGFLLENEFYGVDIMVVQEIIRLQEVSMVPNSPDFVAGVVNLRGKVVPIISLRERFGMPNAEPTKDSRIIITQIPVGTVGFIVDKVTEVFHISQNLIDPPLEHSTSITSDCIKGLGKLNEQLVIVLDLTMVLSKEPQA